MAEQRKVRFSGMVQGVGFRYTTARIAERHAVSGWVKNCPDGTVLLTVEGDKQVMDAFLQEIQERMGQYIRDVQMTAMPATGRLNGFVIEH